MLIFHQERGKSEEEELRGEVKEMKKGQRAR